MRGTREFVYNERCVILEGLSAARLQKDGSSESRTNQVDTDRQAASCEIATAFVRQNRETAKTRKREKKQESERAVVGQQPTGKSIFSASKE